MASQLMGKLVQPLGNMPIPENNKGSFSPKIDVPINFGTPKMPDVPIPVNNNGKPAMPRLPAFVTGEHKTPLNQSPDDVIPTNSAGYSTGYYPKADPLLINLINTKAGGHWLDSKGNINSIPDHTLPTGYMRILHTIPNPPNVGVLPLVSGPYSGLKDEL